MRRQPARTIVTTAVVVTAILAGAGLPLAADAGAPDASSAPGADAAPTARLAKLPKPVADYRFDGRLRSSVKGAPALKNVGAGNKFVVKRVPGEGRTKVLSFPEGNGLALATKGLVASNAYSVVLQFTLANVGGGGYSRVLNPTLEADDNDNGLYVYDDYLVWYDGDANSGTEGSIAPKKFVEVAFTRSAAGAIRVYLNGGIQIKYDDADDQAVIQDHLLRFFVDNSNSEDSAGHVSHIRMYTGALTARKVKKIYAAGH